MSVELIAEIGSNWNGDEATALTLMYEARAAGADTVKFQHYPDKRYGPHRIPVKLLGHLKEAADSMNLGFLCSVFDLTTLIEYVEVCQPKRVKIASPELVHHELLQACALHGLHILLSTGMSTPTQILDALNVIYAAGGSATTLHCVSSYPAPPEELNLRAMKRLGEFGDYGLSDHTLDPVVAPVMAVSMGASVIEKHFTLDTSQDGPDHSYALDPAGFKRMVHAVRLAESMLGSGRKAVMPSEDPLARRTPEWMAA